MQIELFGGFVAATRSCTHN